MARGINRREFGVGAFTAATALLANAGLRAQTSDWPVKPIRIIESFPAGVARDPLTRILAGKLTAVLGQQVLVENHPGAGGRIAGEIAAHASPDGYTYWMAAIGDLAVMKYLYKLPYDVDRDFTPVVMFLVVPAAVVVRPTLEARTLAELIAYAKQHPGELTYGSTGIGQSLHLNGLLFQRAAGIELRHVPYAQGSPFNDLLGGHIDIVIDAVNVPVEHIRAGRLRALAVTGTQRFAALPDVPTFTEAGLPAFDTHAGGGLLAPKETPAAILAHMQSAVDGVLKDKTLRSQWEPLGIQLVGGTPAQFADWIAAESTRWGTLIHETGLKIE
ncbi:MAG TPA: tripartite tricarboxylate transporter substrate-binding protein [Xanthobacteraceae bacterium]|jgi:tripartite-type tricarboxylate transporter receptor subunit TctC